MLSSSQDPASLVEATLWPTEDCTGNANTQVLKAGMEPFVWFTKWQRGLAGFPPQPPTPQKETALDLFWYGRVQKHLGFSNPLRFLISDASLFHLHLGDWPVLSCDALLKTSRTRQFISHPDFSTCYPWSCQLNRWQNVTWNPSPTCLSCEW